MEFAKVMAAAFSGGAPGTEIAAPDGSRMRVEQPDQPGVERMLRGGSEEGEWSMRLYKATPQRPEGFPEDMPFLVNEAFCVMQFSNDKTMLVWWGMRGADRIGKELAAQSEANGWAHTGTDEVASDIQTQLNAMGIKQEGETNLQKGNRVRSIMSSSFGPVAFASLSERTVSD
jgi:hypothetical protein